MKIKTTRESNVFNRFFSKVKVSETDCWLWQGYLDQHGYGKFQVNDKFWHAHRWIFTRSVGTPPPGYQLDHLCRVRNCVNPTHLEAVTPLENSYRGQSPNMIRHHLKICKLGHSVEGENLIIRSSSNRPICRTCDRNKWQRKKLKNKLNRLSGLVLTSKT